MIMTQAPIASRDAARPTPGPRDGARRGRALRLWTSAPNGGFLTSGPGRRRPRGTRTGTS
jgi:hypothetical protein